MPIALVDCSNFYVSCERVFDPRLHARPVVVLSNNDGCIIARSDEVKRLPVPMGAPYFQHRERLEAVGTAVFSANFTLYGDLSDRVMRTLLTFAHELEVYSIDEAFLQVPEASPRALEDLGRAIRARVAQWTGIPVRVGMAPTKTLAKVASELAKGNGEGVRYLAASDTAALRSLPVGAVWGIGRQWSRKLERHGVRTAADLCAQSDVFVRRHLNVVGLRLVHELRGVPCLPLERVPPSRKSAVCSRSFGKPVSDQAALLQALTVHASRAAAKLRRSGLAARTLRVFLQTGHRQTGTRLTHAATLRLAQPSSYTPTLLTAVRRGLGQAWRPGQPYRKAGVMLLDLVPADPHQAHLFEPAPPDQAALMEAVDAINRRMGRDTVVFGTRRPSKNEQREPPAWTMTREHCSPRYTTRWDELPIVHA